MSAEQEDGGGGGPSEADELRGRLRETEQLLIARSSELEALQNEAVHTTLKTMILKASCELCLKFLHNEDKNLKKLLGSGELSDKSAKIVSHMVTESDQLMANVKESCESVGPSPVSLLSATHTEPNKTFHVADPFMLECRRISSLY